MKEELNLVKEKIYSELVLKKEDNMYEPHKFREFVFLQVQTNYSIQYTECSNNSKAVNRPQISQPKESCFSYLQPVLLPEPNMQSHSN